MKPLPFPVRNAGSGRIGVIKIDIDRLERSLGAPHITIDDYDPTEFLGPVRLWAFELTSGGRFVVEFLYKEGYASIYANPPDLDAVLREAGLNPDRVDYVASPSLTTGDE